MKRSPTRLQVAAYALVACAVAGALQPTPAAPQTQGRIYLVPLGPGAPLPLAEVAGQLRQLHKLNVTVLPEVPLGGDPRIEDGSRFQLVAEELLAYMARKHPKLSWEPGAVVIGVTARDMFTRSAATAFVFGYRERDRFAVVSTARMDPAWYAQPADRERLMKRLRKMVTQTIGFLYYRYPESKSPRSVMFTPVLSLEDLDRLSEDF